MAIVKPLSKFDVLIEVAADKLMNLKASESTVMFEKKAKRKSSIPRKKPLKKINSYEELCAMSARELIDQFTISVHDEMAKKFSYTCTYSPSECSITMKSYGSEKKAFDDMKDHLKIHLDAAKNGPFPVDTTPTSPPILNEKYFLDKTASSRRLELEDTSGQGIVTEFDNSKGSAVLERMLERFCSNFLKLFDTCRELQYVLLKRRDFRFRYLQFFTDVCKIASNDHTYSKESMMKQISDSFFMDVKRNILTPLDPPAILPMLKSTVNFSSEADDLEPSALESDPNHFIIQPQFIIETPKVPYIYGPHCFDIAGIEELNEDGTSVDPKSTVLSTFFTESGTHPDYFKCSSRCCADEDDIQGKEKLSMLSYKQRHQVTVLECMENQVNMKSVKKSRVPRNRVLQDYNSENWENLQKIGKELAYRLIAQAHAQKKKQPLKCEICVNKHFPGPLNLIHHYRIHADLKLYTCKICTRRFTRLHSLKYHMSIHENSTRFQCMVCKHRFRHPSHYKEHVRNHTGETPFECSDCHLRFKTRSAYKRHLKGKHNKQLSAKNEVIEMSEK